MDNGTVTCRQRRHGGRADEVLDERGGPDAGGDRRPGGEKVRAGVESESATATRRWRAAKQIKTGKQMCFIGSL